MVANAPDRQDRALRAACRSINARIGLWNGTLNKLRNSCDLAIGWRSWFKPPISQQKYADIADADRTSALIDT
ncbi:MAG TPA: hypothetical protein VGM07_05740 [Stellaceae bacterium]